MTEQTLSFPYATPPAPGEWIEVADGIYWLRFPLPLALNHVHVWLLRDGADGWFCIDSGWGGQVTHDLWDRIIAEKLGGKPITRLLITHYHPDHIGSAGYLYEKFRPQILMTQVEWLNARMLALDTGNSMAAINAEHQFNMGLPEADRAMLQAGGNAYASNIDLPPPQLTPLQAGDTLRIDGGDWTVLVGGGHAPAQISLFNAQRNIYIAADQVLPRISPNVSVWASNPQADALGIYLETLADIRGKTTADALVLPSHNLVFQGLHDRIDQLTRHHDERLEQIIELCRPAPLTVYELADKIFDRKLDRTQTIFAIGEILAHVNHLWLTEDGLGKIQHPGQPWRFFAA